MANMNDDLAARMMQEYAKGMRCTDDVVKQIQANQSFGSNPLETAHHAYARRVTDRRIQLRRQVVIGRTVFLSHGALAHGEAAPKRRAAGESRD